MTSVTSYTAGRWVRTVEGDRETLIDLASGRIVTLDHAKKEYWERTFDEIEAARKQSEEQIASMVAQAQAQAQMAGAGALFGGGGPPKVGAPMAQTVNGFECQETKVETATLTAAICVSTALKPPVDPAAFRKLDLLRPRMRMMGPGMGSMGAALDEVAKVQSQGLVIREKVTINMMGNVREAGREVVTIDESAVATFTVEAPAGYKKIDPPQPQMRMRGPGL
jgi:hypothetical protein